jgi:hypothetical protein
VDSPQELQSPLLIQAVIRKINLPDAVGYFKALGECRHIVIAHPIVFKIYLIFMTLELHKPVWYGYQILLAALLQEGGLCLLLVLPSLDTLVDVFVVFEKLYNRSLPDSFFVVKLLSREPFILGALRISLD